jgi:hypothetical protein
MHRHECNIHNFLFNLENQTKDFSYTIFPVKKINVGKILKLRENRYLIILSIHILKLEISGCDTGERDILLLDNDEPMTYAKAMMDQDSEKWQSAIEGPIRRPERGGGVNGSR